MRYAAGTVEVCICTHNPDRLSLRRAIASVTAQTDTIRARIRITVVDNGSVPEIEQNVIREVVSGRTHWRIIREPTLGVARARLRAIVETSAPWILFVDDDNELDESYLRIGLDFIESNTDVGCFGGKLSLPEGFQVPDWAIPFLPYLAIKDAGEELLSRSSPAWGPWEPPTAGAWVRRDVAKLYADRMMSEPILFDLGRTGLMGLGSCEDSLMMRGAYNLGLKCAYVPRLNLTHHISPKRINFPYLLALLAGYGRSQVLLEHALGQKHPLAAEYEDTIAFNNILTHIVSTRSECPRYRAARLAWQLSARRQHQLLLERPVRAGESFDR